jgi:hypothetical protein
MRIAQRRAEKMFSGPGAKITAIYIKGIYKDAQGKVGPVPISPRQKPKAKNLKLIDTPQNLELDKTPLNDSELRAGTQIDDEDWVEVSDPTSIFGPITSVPGNFFATLNNIRYQTFCTIVNATGSNLQQGVNLIIVAAYTSIQKGDEEIKGEDGDFIGSYAFLAGCTAQGDAGASEQGQAISVAYTGLAYDLGWDDFSKCQWKTMAKDGQTSVGKEAFMREWNRVLK